MTSIIKLTPFSGVDDESPPCFLLQIDEFRFLLDCGWDEHFGMDLIKNLKRHVHHLDAVLLSYPDPFHLGALPYLVGKLNLKCPIYATIPVHKMGQLFMYDVHQSKGSSENFDLFSLDDVDLAFERIQQITYNQTVNVKGRIGTSLQITALPAGHMVGGSVWKIVKDGNEVIVYGVDYNHLTERHLGGCELELVKRPHLFITDCYSVALNQTKEEQLYNQIVGTLRKDGNVLVAVDTAGRVLEIAHYLEQKWRDQSSGLLAYNLVLLNNVSYNVVEFAKSLVEWMSKNVKVTFESHRNNQFQFKHVQLCHSLAELGEVPEPKVVLASTPDMESGFSRELFVQWCGNPNNTIILTNKTSKGTLTRSLIDDPTLKTVTLEVKKKVPLEGVELEEYRRREREKRVDRVKSEDITKVAEEEDSGSDSDTYDMEDTSRIFKESYDLIVDNFSNKRRGSQLFKQAKKMCYMFPYKESKIKYDDYGAVLDLNMFASSDGPTYEEEVMDTSETFQPEVNEELPTKCISMTETLNILANVSFIDFQGRSDGECMKKILPHMKPREMIIMKGYKRFMEKYADLARQHMPKEGKVLNPKLYETLDATMDNRIYQVKLTDCLVSSLHFINVKGMEVAWIDSALDLTHAKPDTSAEPEGQTSDSNATSLVIVRSEGTPADDEAEDVIPTLDSLSPAMVPAHQSSFINNLRLSEFKQILTKHCMEASFKGGLLLVSDRVSIKKNEKGQMCLTGTVCEEYYKVRNLIYEEFAKL